MVIQNILNTAEGVNTMEEEVDSRNTAFRRFRDADQDDSSDSVENSYYKRQRVSTEAPNQEKLREKKLSDKNDGKTIVAATGQSQGLVAVPKLNWNAGTKTTIGISLKNRRRADNPQNADESTSNDAGKSS